jgi:hypothetical protein
MAGIAAQLQSDPKFGQFLQQAVGSVGLPSVAVLAQRPDLLPTVKATYEALAASAG